MALTASTMVPLGQPAQPFDLLDPASGKRVSRNLLLKEKGLLVIFMCNHCPYVKHILPGLRELVRDYRDSDVGLVAISSNDVVNYPEDAPERMANLDLGCAYLYDETQQVAKAYDAVCTPEFYLFDGQLKLVYRGQFDSSRPGNDIPVTGEDLRQAIDSLVSGGEIVADQKPGMGCNIKWRD